MSALEESITSPTVGAHRARGESILSRLLSLLSSVRLGVVLLCLLGLACLIGMLIMQQNVDGFANYFQTLTPAQRLVYGKLGFFDIYHGIEVVHTRRGGRRNSSGATASASPRQSPMAVVFYHGGTSWAEEGVMRIKRVVGEICGRQSEDKAEGGK